MLNKRYDTSIEKKWQERWEREGIYKFNEESGKPIYSIDTPPPFTSGKLHMGHVLSYSYFDFVARYKRMKGYEVLYPQGWDAQGFPTEVKVEKKYGRISREEFRKKCIEWSNKMIENMRKQMKLMGFSADWSREYITMTPEYHKVVQKSIIEMYKKGYIYRDKHPVLWCPYCGSAIAKAETDEKVEKTNLVFFKFKGKDKDVIIASTRPELLHSCVAVLVNEKDERYKDLIGEELETPLGDKVKVIGDKDVDKEFGTGAVMVCTYGDKQDVIWQKRHNLKLIEAIDKRGRIINSNKYDGLKIKEARKKVIELLKESGSFVKMEEIEHSVKIHDRCKREVELLPSKEWFARVKENAEKIKEMAKEIEWIPKHGISHIMNWLNTIDWDWVISRDRTFGTPIPFYICSNEKCDNIKIAESLPFYPEKSKKIMCDKCGSEMKAEEKVFDVWVDSSITPLIITKWDEDGNLFKKAYPTSLRPQGVEIVRTWAFYTIFRSGVALTGKKPWKKVLLNGNVLALDGKKMSKSLGNIIDPEDLLKKYSADAIRQWAAMSGVMAKDRPFSYEDINYAKQFLNKVWNSARFVEKALEEYDEGGEAKRVVDKWIIGRVNEVAKELEEDMEKFDFRSYITKLQNFVWHEFCDYYLEYVKWRVYGEEEEKKNAQYTLKKTFEIIVKLLYPISPHISEEIHKEVLRHDKSIALSSWPKEGEVYNEEKEVMKYVNKAIREIRNHKARNGISLKEELEEVTIQMPVEIRDAKEDLIKTAKIKKLNVNRGEFSIEIKK